jgi:tubulin-specific chaperone A
MAMEETKKVLPSLRQKIVDSVKELEVLIVSAHYVVPQNLIFVLTLLQAEESQKGTESNAAHIIAAQESVSKAKAAQR